MNKYKLIKLILNKRTRLVAEQKHQNRLVQNFLSLVAYLNFKFIYTNKNSLIKIILKIRRKKKIFK